jgi:hypothetical protein
LSIKSSPLFIKNVLYVIGKHKIKRLYGFTYFYCKIGWHSMSPSGCKLNDWCGYHSFLSTKVYQIKIATSYGVNHWYYKPIEIYLAQKMREEKIPFSSLAY